MQRRRGTPATVCENVALLYFGPTFGTVLVHSRWYSTAGPWQGSVDVRTRGLLMELYVVIASLARKGQIYLPVNQGQPVEARVQTVVLTTLSSFFSSSLLRIRYLLSGSCSSETPLLPTPLSLSRSFYLALYFLRRGVVE